MAQRSAAQNGQNSAPMNSISGLPLLVSGVSEILVIAGAPPSDAAMKFGTDPMPTVFSVLAGTLVTSRAALADSAVPVTPPDPDPPLPGLLNTLTRMSASTMAS